ncbi:MAG: hypothetical protein P1V13_25745 [Rhizobiaceae bacterium]|nr:hypothetical protein [Rhizobiaceae bacterium]
MNIVACVSERKHRVKTADQAVRAFNIAMLELLFGDFAQVPDVDVEDWMQFGTEMSKGGGARQISVSSFG